MKISWQDRTLTIDSKSIELPTYVEKALEFNGRVIVLLGVNLQPNRKVNVLAFNEHGEQVWQIEPAMDRFVGLRVSASKRIVVRDLYLDTEFYVDAETGALDPAEIAEIDRMPGVR